MKYVNADDIIPPELLKEVQRYIEGYMVYIPNREGVRKRWGENSGYRNQLLRRNQEIRERFGGGETIDRLAAGFHLSHESIKKIVYGKPPC